MPEVAVPTVSLGRVAQQWVLLSERVPRTL